MGSRQTINAFSEQSSSHERDHLGGAMETATNRRARVTTRAQKKRQDSVEPMQDVYALPLPSQSQSLENVDSELYRICRPRRHTRAINIRAVSYKLPSSSEEDTDGESTSTRIRTSRKNKRTQDSAELDEPESSTSHNTASRQISRPNKRRAIRAEEEVSREQDGYPVIILPPPYRSDSPRPTIRRTAESETIQDSSSYLQPFNLPATGNNTGGVITLPPISLPQENSTHGGITLPPIRSVISLGERSRTPEINNEIEVVDLSSPPSYPNNNAEDPYPSNVVDLTSSPIVLSPNTHSPAINSHKNPNNNTPEIIIIDDDSSVEGSPLPKGLQIKCAICLDHPKDVSFTPCGHIFCRECISTALKSQKVCSLCRRALTKKQIKRLEFKILLK